jgi:hypothetical protein
MSELGPLAYGPKDEPVFLGREFAQRSEYSQDTAIRIDREVNRIVQSAYERATRILMEHRAVLDRIAHDLLERESLDGEEVYRTLREMTGEDPAPTRPVPPGEGLIIGGNEVPEPVMQPRSAAAPGEMPADIEPEMARERITID